jgi:parvulin-like peptidyl-prolyl isomerase
MRRFSAFFLVIGLFVPVSACKNKPEQASKSQKTIQESNRVEVQHILIGFEGTIPGKQIKRSQKEAEKLANKLLKEAQASANFEALVKKYTDDRVPGIYAMSNRGIPPQGVEFPRGQMAPAFGDISFQLEKGEVGLAVYNEQNSPFGFHIIKRLK